MMLDDESMARVTSTFPGAEFSEDMQTESVDSWTGANASFAGHRGANGASSAHPDWGRYENEHPSQWPGTTGEGYRRCCTSITWPGQVITLQALGAKDEWNHDAFFDYVDRWMNQDDTTHIQVIQQETGSDYSASWSRQGQAWDTFVEEMYWEYIDTSEPIEPPAGEIHYVRDGASGDGSDWANAWSQLPNTLERGHTYYIADGEYPGYNFDDAESGDEYIYVKKATVDDHGTDVGWQNGYGNGIADFSGEARFYTSFWDFNGQTGYEDGTTEPHGFRFVQSNCAVRSYGLVRLMEAVEHVKISHIEIEQCGEGVPGNVEPRFDGIQSLYNSNNIIFSYLYIHDFNRGAMLVHNMQDSVVEHSFFEHRLGANYEPDRTIHGGGIIFENSQDITYRYNIFRDIRGTAGIEPKDSVQSHMYMYGNIFYNTDSQYMYSNGAISNTGSDTNTHMHVYNNLFVDLDGSGSAVGWFCGSGYCTGADQDTNVAHNNIVYNSVNGASHVISFLGSSHDYNVYDDGTHGEVNGQHWTGGAGLFVNYQSRDFRLTQPTEPGTTLSPPYDVDPDGTVRGDDGVWDRGAYEFTGVSTCGNGNCDASETCQTCLQDCTSVHDADNNPCNGIISLSELIDYIDSWKAGDVSLQNVIGAIVIWKV